jgi:hypothetical protein
MVHLLNAEPIRRLPARGFGNLEGLTCLKDSLGGLAKTPVLPDELPAISRTKIRVITPQPREIHRDMVRFQA